jgi:hypothetical protein
MQTVGCCARVRHPARFRCRENERASQRPFDEYPYTRLAEPTGLTKIIWDVDVFVSRRGSDRQLAIGPGSVHGRGMSNHAPLHSFEIIFYSIASLLAATGLAWYLLR